MEVGKLCRSCMKELSSREMKKSSETLAEMFTFCTKITVSATESPKCFCRKCSNKIPYVYKFILEALRVNEVLNNIITIKNDECENTETIHSCNGEIKTEATNEINPLADAVDDEPIIKLKVKIESITDNVEGIEKQEHNSDIQSNKFSEVSKLKPAKPTLKLSKTKRRNNTNKGTSSNHPENANPQLIPTHTEILALPAVIKHSSEEIKLENNLETKDEDCESDKMNQQESDDDFKVEDSKDSDSDISEASLSNYKIHKRKRKDLKLDTQCHVCDKDFKYAKCLLRHQRTQHGIDIEEDLEPKTTAKQFTCDVCSACFCSKVVMQKHKERIHAKTDGYVCPYCPEVFSKYGSMVAHKRAHPEHRLFPCPDCSESFSRRPDLAHHVRAHGIHACIKCEMMFKRKIDLCSHMKSHDEERPQLCTVCGSTFRTPQGLVDHTRVHTKERPYACADCAYRTGSRFALSRHRRGHVGVRAFACQLCPKAYFEKWRLKIHTRTHSGERPHKCSSCGKGFTTGQFRNRHMVQVHKIDRKDIPRYDREGNPIVR